jgi:hypothetical protein
MNRMASRLVTTSLVWLAFMLLSCGVLLVASLVCVSKGLYSSALVYLLSAVSLGLSSLLVHLFFQTVASIAHATAPDDPYPAWRHVRELIPRKGANAMPWES